MKTFVAALLLCASVAGAQTLTSAECIDCHKDPSMGEKHVDAAKFGASVHAPIECTGCHSDVKAFPHDPAPARPDCGQCHADAVKDYNLSDHATSRAKGVKGAPWCTDCHGTHDILPKSDPKSRTYHLRIPETCAKCHTNATITKGHPLPAPQVIQNYFGSVHGKGALEQGLVVSAVCSDCHTAHKVLPKSNPESTVAYKNVPNTCRKCHEGIFNQFETSTHGKLWASGATRGPVCVTCHTAHGIRSTESVSFREGIASGCSNCHAKKAPTYQDSFHGQATALGSMKTARCSDCHTPHLNLPKADPKSSVNPANLMKTCGKCHTNVNANFATFQPHADPHDKAKSPQVYYVYNWLMKWLLVITFGFFGLHTLLWLQRSIVALIRGELPRHDGETQWITRFATKQRLTHIAIVVSFLALAATGLPLMYSRLPWGKTLAHLFGGVGVSTVLHRLFAVVTFGYALYHLGFLLYGALVRRDKRMFFGPDSLLPRVRDLVDMKNMFRWFFYRGPWPRFDRWTYWEKFDYFAVFWGVPVIGLSGLMLWMAPTVTRILPGWALNVAMLVHGEEALLAVGFIFTFHFFHTHLRPESFPMDQVMFTGKVRLDRFREERPDQYDRMMREGQLADMLTGPPTEDQVTFARWFGFASLFIGLVLIVAIYWSFLLRFFY
jgi:cytochrome b subunit of formate dehydrogenase